MKAMILDNGEKGARLASWKTAFSTSDVIHRAVLTTPLEGGLDTSIIHYSDFSNGTYRPNDVYCFLQGLYAEQRARFDGLSSTHSWRSYMVKLTEDSEYWDQTWFDFGKQCSHALFFTDGGESQFDGDFREVVSVLQNVEVRVGYCYPMAEAQDRLRRALSGSRITVSHFYGKNLRLDSASNLLLAFLPLDIALQLADPVECQAEAERLLGRSDEVSELLRRAWYADEPSADTVRDGGEAEEKVTGLLSRLMELTERAQAAQDAASLREIFGLPGDGDSGQGSELRPHENGFHCTFENLRDHILEYAQS